MGYWKWLWEHLKGSWSLVKWLTIELTGIFLFCAGLGFVITWHPIAIVATLIGFFLTTYGIYMITGDC